MPLPFSVAMRRLSHVGYDCTQVLGVVGWWAVWQDTCGNVRLSEARGRFRGLQGAFYDNHDGKGETALEAALAAAHLNHARSESA